MKPIFRRERNSEKQNQAVDIIRMCSNGNHILSHICCRRW